MLRLHRNLDNHAGAKDSGGVSSEVLLAVFKAAWRASRSSTPQDVAVSENEAKDAGLAITEILNAALRSHGVASPKAQPALQCPREVPGGVATSGSSQGCPYWSGGGGETGEGSSWNPNRSSSPGNGEGSSDSQEETTKFDIDAFGDSKVIENPEVRFACPYRKYFPHDHTASKFPDCALTGFRPDHTGFTALKEHIKDYHSIRDNYECSRCGAGFAEDSQAKAHSNRKVCPQRPRKIGQVRLETLKSRRAPLGPTWVRKWISIFCICFPEFKENTAGITYCSSSLLTLTTHQTATDMFQGMFLSWSTSSCRATCRRAYSKPKRFPVSAKSEITCARSWTQSTISHL